MLPVRWLAPYLVAVALALGGASQAGAACEKSIGLREGLDGRKQPYRVVHCDAGEGTELLAGSSHLALCDPKALAASGASFEACAGAVDAARTALRRAKLRAALREGADEEELSERYGATSAELEALR